MNMPCLDNPRVKGLKMFRWGWFWVFSVSLDQVEFPVVRKATGGFRALISSLLVACFVLAFALNNIYKAVLNVNYVTGNELLCPWSRLDQLMNFSALYIPAGACLWKKMESKHKSDCDISKEQCATAMCVSCMDKEFQEACKEPIDETLCIFNDEIFAAHKRIEMKTRRHGCRGKIRDIFGLERPDDSGCFDPALILLRKYNRLFERFPQSELPMYIKSKLNQPRTALLVTEKTFPGIWQLFEQAMAEDRSLKFSHNYLSGTDSSVFLKKQERLLVASGMSEPYTRLVTDRLHNLLSSGTWEHWKSLSIRRNNESKFELAGLAPFTPISMDHDSIYVLLLITVILTGVSTVTFLVTACLKQISKIKMPSRSKFWPWKPTNTWYLTPKDLPAAIRSRNAMKELAVSISKAYRVSKVLPFARQTVGNVRT